MTTRPVRIGPITIGGGAPLVLIGGPCAIENEKHALMIRIGMSACSCRWIGIEAAISARNHPRKSADTSMAPPPTMRASGSKVLTI